MGFFEDRNARIKAAIRNFKPTPEYPEKLRQRDIDRDTYMKLPRHEWNCNCARCMSEFIEKHP